MSPKTENMFFVLREGATQEEQWSWEDIEDMSREGDLSANSRVFLPDRNTWVRLADTDLSGCFDPEDITPVEAPVDEKALAQEEYTLVRERLVREGQSADLLVEAGRLASESGDREASRRHFQDALDLQPFHGRARGEITRRFSRVECLKFRYLERPHAVWDDFEELVTYPLAAGPIYAAVPAVVAAILSFVPFGGWVTGLLFFLWGYQIMRHVSRGINAPPLWHAAFADPMREIVLPVAAAVAVALEYGLVFFGIARGAMFLEKESGSVAEYISGSPILIVTIPVILIALLPAIVLLIAHRSNPFIALLPWKVVRCAIRVEVEYATTLLLLLVTAFLVGLVGFVAGGIPVAGNIIHAAVLSYAVGMSGFVMGRLLGRNGHLLDRRR
jgi:hypothetical protein